MGKDSNNHLRIDDTLISLISDYHNVSVGEVISYFHGLVKQMAQVQGNVVNKNKAIIPQGRDKHGRRTYSHKKNFKIDASGERFYDYDAYALRGYYPGSKIPFKISGIKQAEWRTACWVVAIGDKDKNSCFANKELHKLDEIVSEAVLLDELDKEAVEKIYKKKQFRCMRPEGLPLLNKGEDVSKEKE